MPLQGTMYIFTHPASLIDELERFVDHMCPGDFDFTKSDKHGLAIQTTYEGHPDSESMGLEKFSESKGCVLLIHEYFEDDEHFITTLFNGNVIKREDAHYPIDGYVDHYVIDEADQLNDPNYICEQLARELCQAIGDISHILSINSPTSINHRAINEIYGKKAKALLEEFKTEHEVRRFIKCLK